MQVVELEVLTGTNNTYIDRSVCPSGLHHDVVLAFLRLQQSALVAGFDLAVASSFRSFDRQLLIWNEKATGKRPLYDERGELLVFEELAPWPLAQAILRWSALPGASRHHWGTDLDVYDRAAVPPDYQVQLSPAEVNTGGPFHAMHDWLDQQLAADNAEGFFRPYERDRGGVAPERWHLSYAPLAADLQQQLSMDSLAAFIDQQNLALKTEVLEHMQEIYHRYVEVPVAAYPEQYRWTL